MGRTGPTGLLRIDSLESIPRLLKRLQIEALYVSPILFAERRYGSTRVQAMPSLRDVAQGGWLCTYII
jgi:hypothetical protein